jgi:hypothetical protein
MPTTITSPQRPSRKRPADYTGKKTAELQELRKEDILESSSRMALITSEAQKSKEDIIDYSDSDEPLPEVEVRKAELATPYRMIRVNTDIDQMVYGRSVVDEGDMDNPDISLRRPSVMGPMKFWDFKEGQLYKVKREIAEHLDNLGYLSYQGGI